MFAEPLHESSSDAGIKTQIVVPIYNEGENVVQLYKSLLEVDFEWDELKFVHDTDNDTTLPFIARINEEDPRVIAEKNCFGRGVVHAMRWGFAHVSPGPVLVLMGDNSDKLSVIPDMLKAWREGATLVAPSRYMPGGEQHGGPPFKTFLSRTAGTILKAIGFPISDATNNFKLYDGEWLKSQRIESVGGFEIALELSYKAHLQSRVLKELPTEWWDRTQGESNFKIWSWMPSYLRWYIKALSLTFRRQFFS